MVRWTGVVLAFSAAGDDEMNSRLPAWLHPVAGRPLVWHTAWALAQLPSRPERLQVLTSLDLPPEVFDGLPVEVEVVVLSPEERLRYEPVPIEPEARALVIDAAAFLPVSALESLTSGEPGWWIPVDERQAMAAWLDVPHLAQLLRLPEPFHTPNGVLAGSHRRLAEEGGVLVRDRASLARATRGVRDRLIRSLMEAGATFLLPETVLVDVDVRIGRDSVVYPGVVLEGQTTIGDETVIGPGCRIIDSWVGSGVELKGWNYISHTSIRNRAILEPYVRRGFD